MAFAFGGGAGQEKSLFADDVFHWVTVTVPPPVSGARWHFFYACASVKEEFGVAYHPGHVRKLLHQIGFSVQRPRRVLARADAVAQDRWHRRTYPNLKKKPKHKAGR